VRGKRNDLVFGTQVETHGQDWFLIQALWDGWRIKGGTDDVSKGVQNRAPPHPPISQWRATSGVPFFFFAHICLERSTGFRKGAAEKKTVYQGTLWGKKTKKHRQLPLVRKEGKKMESAPTPAVESKQEGKRWVTL